jgi:hypothetical protein
MGAISDPDFLKPFRLRGFDMVEGIECFKPQPVSKRMKDRGSLKQLSWSTSNLSWWLISDLTFLRDHGNKSRGNCNQNCTRPNRKKAQIGQSMTT